MKLKLTALLLIVGLFSVAQGTITNVSGWNICVSTPTNYATSGKTYPTIIFFVGLGEVLGQPNITAADVHKNGPNAYVKQGWNNTIAIDGKNVEFIVVSMQPNGTFPSEDAVETRMKWLRANYRVDLSNQFLTGLSMGGGVAGSQVSYGTFYKYYKAIATFAGMLNDWNGGKPFAQFDNFVLNGGKYLCVEQKGDIRYNEQIVTRMNTVKAGSANYIVTNFGAGTHCCWQFFYGGLGTQPQPIINGLNVYQWFAKQVTSTTTPPVVTPPPTPVYSQVYVDSLVRVKDQQIFDLNETVKAITALLNAANTDLNTIKPEYLRILGIFNNIITQICNK